MALNILSRYPLFGAAALVLRTQPRSGKSRPPSGILAATPRNVTILLKKAGYPPRVCARCEFDKPTASCNDVAPPPIVQRSLWICKGHGVRNWCKGKSAMTLQYSKKAWLLGLFTILIVAA